VSDFKLHTAKRNDKRRVCNLCKEEIKKGEEFIQRYEYYDFAYSSELDRRCSKCAGQNLIEHLKKEKETDLK
jgi:hypothetical protein